MESKPTSDGVWRPDTTPKRSYLVGLDLGQAQDFSGLTVVQRTKHKDGVNTFLCNHINRWKLGTSYPTIVKDVCDLMMLDDLWGEYENWRGTRYVVAPTLLIDATGVGRPIVDMFRQTWLGRQSAGSWLAIQPVTIHGGQSSGPDPAGHGWSVAKKDLVGSIQAALGLGRLKIVSSLEHAETLKKELEDFRIRLSPSGHEGFSAREGAHDDLVLSLAMCLWFCSGHAFHDGRGHAA
jgi:hypothetical protein